MTIETTEDLANQIADWLGIYGSCKSECENSCENESDLCCRVGFMLVFPDRIRNAVHNEDKLNFVNLLDQK